MVPTDGQGRRPAPSAVAHVAASRVFFAHQSVGDNIVDGLSEFAAMRVAEGTQLDEAATPRFLHARLGRNGDPRSKTEAFIAVLDAGLGDRVDAAFQKYCFVDIDADTDVAQLFQYYRQSMARIHQRFPDLLLVHVTAPLTTVQGGPKAAAKRLLGRMPDGYADNFARERFNQLLRREYGGGDLLFDLAALESSRPGSKPELIRFGDLSGLALLADFSSDGGHLNEVARGRVAAELVTFLDRALQRRPTAAARAGSGL